MSTSQEKTAAPKVLVVDDSIELGQGISRTFRACGIQCHVETDGRKALDVLRETNFDLIITDIKMPNVGGDVLVRCIGQLRPELPCIVMTGLSEQDTLDFVGKSPNVVALLKKPLNSQRLAIMIHGFCRTPAGERADFQYWRTMLAAGQEALSSGTAPH